MNSIHGCTMQRKSLLPDGVVEFFEYNLHLEIPALHGAFEWCLDEDVTII